ncbi:TKL protein kinase [Thecamonas trahens ATCC 50062]|uniref:TKL protein kinase n=1 Tax=Thecamonas trahens ATCC 50062 TaxID=461836 RepID=A0A0L0D2Q0_THETB|nr:TKL protein kinase [Thecamonas trahens ATCC 50062]KNC46574.1 TKL protein kinase [Thecamonas trahens ATCC 50062]|eukprot:XP_013760351.1 TKL protein kinase [Thecamonas trahens ATCC 50062]
MDSSRPPPAQAMANPSCSDEPLFVDVEQDAASGAYTEFADTPAPDAPVTPAADRFVLNRSAETSCVAGSTSSNSMGLSVSVDLDGLANLGASDYHKALSDNDASATSTSSDSSLSLSAESSSSSSSHLDPASRQASGCSTDSVTCGDADSVDYEYESVPQLMVSASLISSVASGVASKPSSSVSRSGTESQDSDDDDASISISFSQRLTEIDDVSAENSLKAVTAPVAPDLSIASTDSSITHALNIGISVSGRVPTSSYQSRAQSMLGASAWSNISSTAISPSTKSTTSSFAETIRSAGGKTPLEAVAWADLTISYQLGSGGFGEVWGGTWGATSVAIKRLTLKGDGILSQLNDLVAEASVLASLSHPNIVQMLAICTDTANPAIVTELMESGDLFEALFPLKKADLRKARKEARGKNPTSSSSSSSSNTPSSGAPSASTHSSTKSSSCGTSQSSGTNNSSHGSSSNNSWSNSEGSTGIVPGHLSDRSKLHILHGVCCGMEYLHRCGILHCDLKPRNILLSRAGSVVKVADFGLALTLASGSVRGFAGTPRYSAPEVIMGDAPCQASDVFSFGILLYETVTQLRAFPKISRIKNCYASLLPPAVLAAAEADEIDDSLPEVYDSRLFRLTLPIIIKCIQHQPDSRPSFAELASSFDSLITHLATTGEVFPSVPPLLPNADVVERPRLVRSVVRSLTARGSAPSSACDSPNIMSKAPSKTTKKKRLLRNSADRDVVVATNKSTSRDRLLVSSDSSHARYSSHGVVAIGGPGSGKTWLASTIAHEPEVGAKFRDGIHWLSLSSLSSLSDLVNSLALELNIKLRAEQLQSLRAARDAISSRLADKALLLVLDGLVSASQLALCHVLVDAPDSRYLATTTPDVVDKLVGSSLPELTSIVIPELGTSEARALFAIHSGLSASTLPDVTTTIMTKVALNADALCRIGDVVARQCDAVWTFASDFVTEAVREGMTPQRAAVALAVRSLHAIRYRFRELAVFPAGKLLPVAPLVVLWRSADEPLYPVDVELILRMLADKGIFHLAYPSAIDPNTVAWMLTPPAADLLAWREATSQQAEVAGHTRILRAYTATLADPFSANVLSFAEWRTGPVATDAYYRQNLVRHLLAAGQITAAVNLVVSYYWYRDVTRAERDDDPWFCAGSDPIAQYLDDLSQVIKALSDPAIAAIHMSSSSGSESGTPVDASLLPWLAEADRGAATQELSKRLAATSDLADLTKLRELLNLSRGSLKSLPSMVYFQLLGRMWPVPSPDDVSPVVMKFINDALEHKSRAEMMYVPRSGLLVAHGGGLRAAIRSHPHRIVAMVAVGNSYAVSLCESCMCVWDVVAGTWAEHAVDRFVPTSFLDDNGCGSSASSPLVSPFPSSTSNPFAPIDSDGSSHSHETDNGGGLKSAASAATSWSTRVLIASAGEYFAVVTPLAARIYTLCQTPSVDEPFDDHASFMRAEQTEAVGAAIIMIGSVPHLVVLTNEPAPAVVPQSLVDGADVGASPVLLDNAIEYDRLVTAAAAPLAAISTSTGVITVVDFSSNLILFHAAVPLSDEDNGRQTAVTAVAVSHLVLVVATDFGIYIWSESELHRAHGASMLAKHATSVEVDRQGTARLDACAPTASVPITDVSSLYAIPESMNVVVGRANGELVVVSAISGRMLGALDLHSPSSVTSMTAVTYQNAELLVSGDADGLVCVWNVANVLTQLGASGRAASASSRGLAHRSEITALTAHGEMNLVITGSGDRTINVCDTQSGAVLDILLGHDAAVVALMWSKEKVADGAMLMSVDRGGSVCSWHVSRSGSQRLSRGKVPFAAEISTAALSNRGIMYLGYESPDAVVGYSVQPGATRSNLSIKAVSHLRDVSGAVLVCKHGYVAARGTAPYNATVSMFSAKRHVLVSELSDVHFGMVTSIDIFQVVKRVLVATGGADQSVAVWDAVTGTSLVRVAIKLGSITSLRLFALEHSSSLQLVLNSSGRRPSVVVLALRSATPSAAKGKDKGKGKGKIKGKGKGKGKGKVNGDTLEDIAEATSLRLYAKRMHRLDEPADRLYVATEGTSIVFTISNKTSYHRMVSLASIRAKTAAFNAEHSDSDGLSILEWFWNDVRKTDSARLSVAAAKVDATQLLAESRAFRIVEHAELGLYLSREPVALRILAANAVSLVVVSGVVFVWVGPEVSRTLYAQAAALARELCLDEDFSGVRSRPYFLAPPQLKFVTSDAVEPFCTQPPYDRLWQILAAADASDDWRSSLATHIADVLAPVDADALARDMRGVLSIKELVLFGNNGDLVLEDVSQGKFHLSMLASDKAYMVSTATALWLWLGDAAPTEIRARVVVVSRRIADAMEHSVDAAQEAGSLLESFGCNRRLAWRDVRFAFEGREPLMMRLALT